MNVIPLGKKLTIAIDVDGTVADYSKVDFSKVAKNPYELMKAKPVKGARAAVKKLYQEGHTIVFHSSREDGSRKATVGWLKKHGFPFHHIVMDKFVAHIYIDDRAIRASNWKHVMREFKKPNLPGKLARRKGMI